MKIAGISWLPLRPRPIKEGYGDTDSVWPAAIPAFLVRVRSDDGTEGYGEAASQVWYLGETAAQIESVLALYAEVLTGQPADNLARAHALMESVYGGGSPHARSSRAAVDMALHDLVAKARGVPVATLLGGTLRTRIDQLTNLYHAPPDAMADAAREFAAQGFKGLKIKVGEALLAHGWSRESFDHELAKLRAALEAVPRGVMIDADANQGWGSPQWTVSALHSLGHWPNLSIEQPLPLDDIAGAAFVRARAGVPLILDEPVRSPEAVMTLIRYDACDRVVIKLNRVGGFHPAMRIVAICEAAGVGVSVDTNPFTKLGDTASAHLAAAIPTPYPADCEGHITFLEMPEGIYTGGIGFEAGRISLPESPGLGISADWDAAKAHASATS